MSDYNTFTDPRTSDEYAWERNHSPDGVDARGFTRQIDHGATVGGLTVVRQQGADQPMTLSYRGVILEQDHHDAMVGWARLGRLQTIYFEDVLGDKFEVLVTSFQSTPYSLSQAAHAWEYTLEMEVITVLAGTWLSTDLGLGS